MDLILEFIGGGKRRFNKRLWVTVSHLFFRVIIVKEELGLLIDSGEGLGKWKKESFKGKRFQSLLRSKAFTNLHSQKGPPACLTLQKQTNKQTKEENETSFP